MRNGPTCAAPDQFPAASPASRWNQVSPSGAGTSSARTSDDSATASGTVVAVASNSHENAAIPDNASVAPDHSTTIESVNAHVAVGGSVTNAVAFAGGVVS